MERKTKKNELPALSSLSPVIPDPASGLNNFNAMMNTSEGPVSTSMGESITIKEDLEQDGWYPADMDIIKSELSDKECAVLDFTLSSYFGTLMTNDDGHYLLPTPDEDFEYNSLDEFITDAKYNAEHWTDEEVTELMTESKLTKLTEGRWNYTLSNGGALRKAIDDEDYVEVLNQIKIAYQEMLDNGIINEYDFESWTADFDDFTDWEDPEGAINYELDNLYDACDNLNIWIPLYESAEQTKNKLIKKPNKLIKEKKEEIAKYSIDSIQHDIVQATMNFMQSKGFDEDEAAAYTMVDIQDTPDSIRVEVGAELSYTELMELSDVLDSVISKYSTDAYFEAEDTGLLSAVIWKKSTIKESIKSLERRVFDTLCEDYDLDMLYEAVEHKLDSKERSTLQDIIKKANSAEDVSKYLTGLLNESAGGYTAYDNVRAMHEIMLSMNNEDAYDSWIYTMPDEPTQEDFEYFAQDNEEYNYLCSVFSKLYNRYKKDGLYKPAPGLVNWLQDNGYDSDIEVFD